MPLGLGGQADTFSLYQPASHPNARQSTAQLGQTKWVAIVRLLSCAALQARERDAGASSQGRQSVIGCATAPHHATLERGCDLSTLPRWLTEQYGFYICLG
jgi:hypothetical protein